MGYIDAWQRANIATRVRRTIAVSQATRVTELCTWDEEAGQRVGLLITPAGELTAICFGDDDDLDEEELLGEACTSHDNSAAGLTCTFAEDTEERQHNYVASLLVDAPVIGPCLVTGWDKVHGRVGVPRGMLGPRFALFASLMARAKQQLAD